MTAIKDGRQDVHRRCATQVVFTIGILFAVVHIIISQASPKSMHSMAGRRVDDVHSNVHANGTGVIDNNWTQRPQKIATGGLVGKKTAPIEVQLRPEDVRVDWATNTSNEGALNKQRGNLHREHLKKVANSSSLVPDPQLRLDGIRVHGRANRTGAMRAGNESSNEGDRHPNRSATGASMAPVRRERVAVCICGTSRTFHYKPVHESIRKNVVDPLRSAYDTDVFFIMRMDDDPAPGRHKAQARRNATLAAMRSFHPRKVVEFQGVTGFPASRILRKTSRAAVQVLAPESCKFNPNRKAHFSHTLLRTKHCLDVIARHETESAAAAARYDWVYRTRPDIAFLKPITLPSALRTDHLYVVQSWPSYTAAFARWWGKGNRRSVGNGRIGDQVFAASREVAGVAFRSFDIVDNCMFYTAPVRNIETGLRMWLVTKEIPYKALPWVWAIVREKSGPECDTIRFLDHPHMAWNQALLCCVEFAMSLRGIFPHGLYVSKRNLTEWAMNATRRKSDWMDH